MSFAYPIRVVFSLFTFTKSIFKNEFFPKCFYSACFLRFFEIVCVFLLILFDSILQIVDGSFVFFPYSKLNYYCNAFFSFRWVKPPSFHQFGGKSYDLKLIFCLKRFANGKQSIFNYNFAYRVMHYK